VSEERLGIGRICPHCGARTDTLGSVCPACKKPYGRVGGLLDRIAGTARVFLWLWIALIALGFALLFTNLVAGILLLALSFVVLVVGIAVANAAEDTGR
jgi:hypothetical protein